MAFGESNVSFQAGWREIGGINKYYRSKWEANYARYLEWLKKNKQIEDWKHEPKTFWFESIKRGTRSYLPDFWIKENNGSEVYCEVKGYMDSKSHTKLKRMAKYYPEVKLILVDKTAYLAVAKKAKYLVEGWE